MAIQPLAAPPVTQASTAPAAPQRTGCFGRSCGCSCLGCLGAMVLVTLLVLGSGYWFLVVQAQAAVTAPATLIVFNQPVTVNGNASTPGEALNAGDVVATQPKGHAEIQFPDGSYVRMSPNTTVQVTNVQLQRNGTLQAGEVLQKTGRTFVNIQHLASGASFKVGGHSVTAEVRGTEFEVLVREDDTNLIKVFDGTVGVSGKSSATVKAGQEIDADASGTLSAVRGIRNDRNDPYQLVAQCRSAVAQGSNPGTIQITIGDPISSGQNVDVFYDSPGGITKTALCYPGSYMQLRVTSPNGTAYWYPNGIPPIRHQHQGLAGRWKATVIAVDVSPAEPWVVAFAADAPCTSAPQLSANTGNVVRETLSNSELTNGLKDSGITLRVEGTSPNSARLHYYSNIGGAEVSWTVVFYAATPNLGAVVTQVTVRGVNVTTQTLNYLGPAAKSSISSIPQDFTVDRVYSCADAGGDDIMVVEGHR